LTLGALLFSSINCLGIEQYYNNDFTDSITLETKFGNMTIEEECDSTSSFIYFHGQIIESEYLKPTAKECTTSNIDKVQGNLLFSIDSSGILLNCSLFEKTEINSFNTLLVELANEITKKYKNKKIFNCNMNNYPVETTLLPITFTLE